MDEATSALREGAGAFVWPREFVSVHGADAETYLQGQLSQDISAVAVGASADSLLLAPDGKLVTLLRVTRTDATGFLLDVDAGFGDAVVARLRKFLLRSKVELEVLPWRCLSLRGPQVESAAAGLLTVLAEAGVLALPYEWNGWTGLDCIGPRDLVLDPAGGALPGALVSCPVEAVDACRIASGVPLMGAELTDKTIGAEVPGLVERTVSFTKGCYTGQELVARLDARGSKVARRLVGLVSTGGPDDAAARLVYGMTLHSESVSEDGVAGDKVLGTVTSTAWSAELGAWLALGYLHRSVEVPGPLRVRSGDGLGEARLIEARPLPLVTLPVPS
jgi:folate-binding protein YgfZ